ncbi:glycosyltransferase [uncultured Roseibium sp.]|uniref:glycosyltransferase n=1 Tax=uncultured Roseibium sp. TaxID=1936171 RepID=UPI002602FEA5|nr:glycosyltransferase [uncultured Roseibium sp.]
MHIVFVHRHGPGQFVHIARRLILDGWTVTLICESIDRPVPGLRVLRYGNGDTPRASPSGRKDTSVPYIEAGRRVAEILHRLSAHGNTPDLVLGHIAWGGMMFVKDALPDTPMIGFCEYFFQPEGGDVGFAPSENIDLAQRQTLRLRNAVQLSTLDQMDYGISPTRWQKNRYPSEYHSKIIVQHEGIDTGRARPDPLATFRLPDGNLLSAGDPVVTFAARDLEPYRGFPQFMRAAALVAKRIPRARFVVAGGDGVSYGSGPGQAASWRKLLEDETNLAPDRMHFLGQIPHRELIRLFQVSAAHVYLTYPFVLSWSFLEAMSCGAAVIASSTPPVREVVKDGHNGRLVDFWNVDEFAERVEEALHAPEKFQPLRSEARKMIVRRYDLNACCAKLQRLVSQVIGAHSRSKAVRRDSEGLRETV